MASVPRDQAACMFEDDKKYRLTGTQEGRRWVSAGLSSAELVQQGPGCISQDLPEAAACVLRVELCLRSSRTQEAPEPHSFGTELSL